MNELLTTGIDPVIARRLGPRGWRITFRSSHEGMHHQLYLNGRLAAWTDSPGQRSFILDEPAALAGVRIAAVATTHVSTDLSGQLPAEDRLPPWTYRPRIPRRPPIRRGDWIEILGDHATGQFDSAPLARAQAWPEHVPAWAFGQDRFGQGGFGFDGANAPGLGPGAFGAGAFGIDTDLIDIEAILPEEGTHQLLIRTRGSDGQVSDSDPTLMAVVPPPAPPDAILATSYDPQTQVLTLQIN